MQVELTTLIDRYLQNELSASDHAAFELRLQNSTELQRELEFQQLIQEAAIRASFRVDVKHAARRYRLNRIIKWGAAGLGLIALTVTTSVWISSSNRTESAERQLPPITLSVMEELNPSADFHPLPIQYFSVPKEGDVFLSDQSVLLSVPQNAFLLKGKTYHGDAIVQFQEALQANEIVKAGLNTTTGDHLLETQGMFSIHAYTLAGEKLEINPKVGIYVQVPVNEHKAGMNLYDLVKLDDGKTDWQKPRALNKIPMPVDMSELDFYPKGYEAKLDELKWQQAKPKRDSLYLSFEDYCDLQTPEPVRSWNAVPDSAVPNSGAANSSREPINTRAVLVEFPQIEAQFPGGPAALKAFIANNCQYPEQGFELGLQGVVYVSFTVSEFGTVSDAEAIRGVHPLLDKEAARVVMSMPRWIPAETNGKSVKTKVRIPITFSLEGGSKGKTIERDRPNLLGGSMMSLGMQEPQEDVITQIASAQEPATSGRPEPDSIADTPCNSPRVSPSRVLAFWKPKFNNTNLATREFERRMKAIHGTCNNNVLQKYTSQLSKSISQIDGEVVAMGYSEFTTFANEQVGKVNVKNPHLENLQDFYEKGIEALKEQAKKDKNWERTLRGKWDAHVTQLRTAHSTSTKNQEEKSKKDEVSYNQQRTVEKLGLNTQPRVNPVAVYPQFGRTIGFTATQTGGYNCDRSVNRIVTYQAALRSVQSPEILETIKMERARVLREVETGTDKRESFSVSANGKTRTIAYNLLSFEIANVEKYGKLIAYVFPHQLETFQLLEGKDGKFETKLNDDIIYDICVVGISEEGYAYFQKQTLKGGQLGTITLTRLSEQKLDASINQLNAKRLSRPSSIALDLDWIKAESKNYKEVNRRKEMAVFRQKIVTAVYPCFSPSEETFAAAKNPFGI